MRTVPAILMALALTMPTAASAQFGSMLRDAVRGAGKPAKPATSPTDAGCAAAGKASRGSSVLGSVLGGVANRAIGRTGLGYYAPMPEFSTVLTSAFACKLEPKEQKQAADATAIATRGDRVGSTSAWTSEARPGVTGTSTVAGKERLADGSTCMSVRDIAIVNGEETAVVKRMCRAPGAAGYTLSA